MKSLYPAHYEVSKSKKSESYTFFFRKLSSWLRRVGVSGVGSDQVGSVKPVTRLGLGLRLRLSPIWKNPISHSAPFEKLLSTMYFFCILLLRSEIIIFILVGTEILEISILLFRVLPTTHFLYILLHCT